MRNLESLIGRQKIKPQTPTGRQELKDGEEMWYILEFENLRHELSERIIFLNHTINLAIIFWVVFIVMFFGMVTLEVKKETIYTFLLLIPIVMDLLAFSYQTNQSSLESIPKYFHEQIKPRLDNKYKSNILGWEKFFAEQKKPFRVESVTKVLPFLIPSLIPIYFLVAKYPLERYQTAVAIVGIIFLLIVLENFRYKLRRVK
ncbi:MAG: hypothetical protein OEV37_03335 [Candidatus Berkelbacteria bacterium]|nr:hypothetical protein [Candidatus Berkelbacteria bacterium]